MGWCLEVNVKVIATTRQATCVSRRIMGIGRQVRVINIVGYSFQFVARKILQEKEKREIRK